VLISTLEPRWFCGGHWSVYKGYIHPRLVWGSWARFLGIYMFLMWRFIVLSQQLSGAAMVRRWSAYIHPRLVWGQVRGSWARFLGIYVFNVDIYCVITTALWSRDGSAVVSLHPPAASMESSVRFL